MSQPKSSSRSKSSSKTASKTDAAKTHKLALKGKEQAHVLKTSPMRVSMPQTYTIL